MALNHAQIVKDFKKLINLYDYPHDMTGGLVVEEIYEKAIIAGTKTACAKALLRVIEYGFQLGNKSYRYQSSVNWTEVSIDECDFIRYMYETYIE